MKNCHNSSRVVHDTVLKRLIIGIVHLFVVLLKARIGDPGCAVVGISISRGFCDV